MFDKYAELEHDMKIVMDVFDILACDIKENDYFKIEIENDGVKEFATGYCNSSFEIESQTSDVDDIAITWNDSFIVVPADEIITVARQRLDTEPARPFGHIRLYRFADNDDEAVGIHRFYSFEPLWKFSRNRYLYAVDVPIHDFMDAINLDAYNNAVEIDWKNMPQNAAWYRRDRYFKEAIIHSYEAMDNIIVRGRAKVLASPWEKG